MCLVSFEFPFEEIKIQLYFLPILLHYIALSSKHDKKYSFVLVLGKPNQSTSINFIVIVKNYLQSSTLRNRFHYGYKKNVLLIIVAKLYIRENLYKTKLNSKEG